MDFSEIIREMPNKSDWISRLYSNTGKAATETLAFLSTCYSNIPKAKRESIRKRLKSVGQNEVDAIIRELITFELLRGLKLQPEWSPKIKGRNPDLMFVAEGKKFVADVFLTSSPTKTIHKKSDIFTEYWDKPLLAGESRSIKIAEDISEKSTKYSQLNYPLVLFVFFADNLGLDIQQVETALYGMTIDEIRRNKEYPNHATDYVSHPNLSGVIACKWFDTLNPADEGKRLQCVVLHNWATNSNLPTDAFSPFGQIIWNSTGKHKRPQYDGNPNMVAKFHSKDQLEIKPYNGINTGSSENSFMA
jgi:hypothetical protein